MSLAQLSPRLFFQLFCIILCVCTRIEAFPVFFCVEELYPIKNPELSAGSQYIQHAGSYEIQRAGRWFSVYLTALDLSRTSNRRFKKLAASYLPR